MNIPVSTAGLGSAQDSFRLWSLWDLMLKKAAHDMGLVLAGLAQLEQHCASIRDRGSDKEPLVIQHVKETTLEILNNARRACILADLDEPLPEIDRFLWQITDNWAGIDGVQSSASHLKFRLLDELKKEFYFQVDREDVRYYGKKELFGADVAKKFKDASYDIENAGNCLALQQSTACVVHLMRAMEVALRALGKRLRVRVGPKDTIGSVLGKITPKIEAMPERTNTQKRKRERWAEARTNLFHVKQAWRDNSTHGRERYLQSHAHDIFVAVRTFMAHLATL